MGRFSNRITATVGGAKPDTPPAHHVTRDDYDLLKNQINAAFTKLDQIIMDIDAWTIDHFNAFVYTFFAWHVPGILTVDPLTLVGQNVVLTGTFDPLLAPPPSPPVQWYDAPQTVTYPIQVFPIPKGTYAIDRVMAYVKTAPTIDNVILDFNMNNATIFADQDHRPLILVGESYSRNGVPIGKIDKQVLPVRDPIKFTGQDLLSIDIDQADGVASDLTVLLVCRQALEDTI